MAEIKLPPPYGHAHDGNGNQPLSFERGPVTWERSIGCSTIELFTADQLQAYATAAIQADRAERGELILPPSKAYTQSLIDWLIMPIGATTAQDESAMRQRVANMLYMLASPTPPNTVEVLKQCQEALETLAGYDYGMVEVTEQEEASIKAAIEAAKQITGEKE